jgi:transposase
MEDLYQKIRYLRDTQKLTFRQIQQETGINRKTCSRIYWGNWKPPKQRGSLLDNYRDLIAQWFKDHPTLKAIQVYERLKDRGLGLTACRVAQYTRAFRKKKSKVFWQLDFLAGEEGQVDWFFVNHPILGKLCGFALILSYSRYLFAHLFCRHSFEFFIQGHIMALAAFGGCPRALRYDNLKSVVLKREPLSYNPAFLAFAGHYGFEIRLCNPSCGNEKGRVERVIRSLRETFFNTAEHHTSLKAINTALHEWVQNKNNTIHRSTDKTPVVLKEQEKLKPLPGSAWLNALIHPPTRPSKTGFITFDTNRYSVPDYLVDQLLCVRSYPDRVDIHDLKGGKVASHPRSFARSQSFLNPSHRSFNQLSDSAKRQRIYSVIKNLNPLTASFLEHNRATGEDPYASAYVLFKLFKLHGRETILSALREALLRKSPRTKFLLSLLSPHGHLPNEEVQPQDPKLLQLDYQPRPLEDYSHEQ